MKLVPENINEAIKHLTGRTEDEIKNSLSKEEYDAYEAISNIEIKMMPAAKDDRTCELYDGIRICQYKYPMIKDENLVKHLNGENMIRRWFDNQKQSLENKCNNSGKWAIYKYGGFSGYMRNENKRKNYGWHICNFDSKKDAIKYAAFENLYLITWNWGGGIYHVAKDDKTSKPSL